MKIVYLADSLIPSRAANCIHIMKICEAFAQNGHEVTLVAQDSGQSVGKGIEAIYAYYGVEQNFNIHLIPQIPFKGSLFYFGWKAAGLAKKVAPDLVYGRSLVALWYLSKAKIPLIFEVHTTLWDNGGIYLHIFKSLLYSANLKKVVVISEALKGIVKNAFSKLPDAKLAVVHDAATLPDIIEPLNGQFPQTDKMRVGYVGNIYHGRGIELLLHCAEKMPDVEFHIVGGEQKDLATIGVSETPANVKLHGFVSPKTVPAYRGAMDILVAPYQKDLKVKGGRNTSAYMSPLKVFEYMSSGKAIVCSDFPVLREVLGEGNAVMVAPDDRGGWVAAIGRLKDEKLRDKLGQQAYHDFLEHYTWKKRAAKVLENLT